METANREKLLDSFYIAYNNKNYVEAIESLQVIIISQKKKSFWIYSRLSSCYYELKNYENALNYAKMAYKLEPKSPLVLWDYAGVLIMVKKEKRAIKLLVKIQEMNNDLTEYGFEKSEIRWMQSLKIDANFLIGKAYYMICEDNLAQEYFRKYLLERSKNRKSIYTKKMALEYLKKINN